LGLNLVETFEGYASHERGTLEEVTEARERAIDAQGPADLSEPAGEPEPRELQRELAATKDRVAYARQYY
jgi:LemA protein